LESPPIGHAIPGAAAGIGARPMAWSACSLLVFGLFITGVFVGIEFA
jgi:hypothetical protein